MNKPKFRAWDKIDKKMYQVYGWNTSTNEIYICSLPNSAFEDGALHTTHVITRSLDNFILMQYTGLKDKNGVDVYVGDIVRCSSGCPHEVIFKLDHGGNVLGGMPTFYLSGLSEGYQWMDTEEIIGNIHENPELLEVK